jgi:hypothetical protein
MPELVVAPPHAWMVMQVTPISDRPGHAYDDDAEPYDDDAEPTGVLRWARPTGTAASRWRASIGPSSR